MAHGIVRAMLLSVHIRVLEVKKMKFGEVVSDEHDVDQPVQIVDEVANSMSATENDADAKGGRNKEWEDEELDLIAFRCRDWIQHTSSFLLEEKTVISKTICYGMWTEQKRQLSFSKLSTSRNKSNLQLTLNYRVWALGLPFITATSQLMRPV